MDFRNSVAKVKKKGKIHTVSMTWHDSYRKSKQLTGCQVN